ncbi:hypothetical protein BHE74_00007069, partial [Ensete ventricosum]
RSSRPHRFRFHVVIESNMHHRQQQRGRKTFPVAARESIPVVAKAFSHFRTQIRGLSFLPGLSLAGTGGPMSLSHRGTRAGIVTPIAWSFVRRTMDPTDRTALIALPLDMDKP